MNIEELRNKREILYKKNQRLFVRRARLQKEIKKIMYAENVTVDMEKRKARLTEIRDKIDKKRFEIKKRTLELTELEMIYNIDNRWC